MKNEQKIFFLNLYCDHCRTGTWHKIIESNPSVELVCDECGKKTLDYKYGRNNVNRIIWDRYARAKRELGSKKI